MKFVMLLCCTLLHCSVQNEDRHDEIWKECEDGCSKEDLENIFKVEEEPTDEKIRCIPKCVLTKLGFMDGSDKIDYEAVVNAHVEGTTPEERRTVVDACKQPEDYDGCKAALFFLRCVVSKG